MYDSPQLSSRVLIINSAIYVKEESCSFDKQKSNQTHNETGSQKQVFINISTNDSNYNNSESHTCHSIDEKRNTNTAWRTWYRKKLQERNESVKMLRKMNDLENHRRDQERRIKEEKGKESWLLWLQKKNEEQIKLCEKRKKVLNIKPNEKNEKQVAELERWMKDKLKLSKEDGFLQQKRQQEEKEKLENKHLRQKEFDIYFKEWKKKRINYPKPEPPIVISTDTIKRTNFTNPIPWKF